MKKVYIASRIPKNADAKLILEVNPEMTPEEVYELYTTKEEIERNFINNGPWILRPPKSEIEFEENKLPKSLTSMHIWNMVKRKIELSDLFLAIIDFDSFGTIGETGFASNCDMPVYVLPSKKLSDVDLKEFWLIFQMAKSTEHLWSDEDIQMLNEFKYFGINSISDYNSFIERVIPRFMK